MTVLGKAVLLTAISVMVAACGDDAAPPLEPTTETTLEHLISSHPYFMIWGDEVDSTMTVRINRGDGWDTHDIRLDLMSGIVAFTADETGALDINTFDIYYSDIVIDAEQLPPNGLHLSQIHISLTETTTCEQVNWTDDYEYCDIRVATPLLLDWAIQTENGDVVPLGTQPLDGMGVDFAVYQQIVPEKPGDIMALGLDVSAHAPGVVWEWANMIELSELRLSGHGDELILLGR